MFGPRTSQSSRPTFLITLQATVSLPVSFQGGHSLTKSQRAYHRPPHGSSRPPRRPGHQLRPIGLFLPRLRQHQGSRQASSLVGQWANRLPLAVRLRLSLVVDVYVPHVGSATRLLPRAFVTVSASLARVETARRSAFACIRRHKATYGIHSWL